jgi:ABC-type antimicrobial peptide transport system permease subunit
VLKAEDLTSLTGNFLRILNKLVLVFAAIALISGGISIMNIMFVSVSERNQEIGVRKSVGATNNQILSQFLTESIIISFLGAVVGVTCSLIANYVIRLTTNFAPVVSWKIMTLSTLAAIIVGVVFGIIPAIKAARKDPIMALRRL